jgi:chaperonin GroES
VKAATDAADHRRRTRLTAVGRRGAPPLSPFMKIHQRKDKGFMNIRPLQDRVIVERVEAVEKSAGGLFIPDTAKEKPQEGKVIAVGKGKRREDGTLIAPDVKKGDRILFSKYAGSDVTLDGNEYIIMREDDILGVL